MGSLRIRLSDRSRATYVKNKNIRVGLELEYAVPLYCGGWTTNGPCTRPQRARRTKVILRERRGKRRVN